MAVTGKTRRNLKNKTTDQFSCSNAYNFNTYKQFTKVTADGAKNSQGREQMHSILTKLSKSYRQKNYHNFMRHMIAFFAIRNMMIMKAL